MSVAAPTAASALRVINAVLNFRPSPIATTSPINDDDVFTAVSMAAGDMFFPDALMISSFLRSITVRYSSASAVTTSPSKANRLH